MRAIVSLKRSTSVSGCFTKCKAKRKAVFFPMPGNLDNSCTADSNKLDEKFMA
jgi:hypothetical protein